MDKKIIDLINNTIETIWQYDIPRDLDNGWLLREDTLKNAFYYYIRTKLGGLFDDQNIRIFTEYAQNEFAGTGYRPDLVIARIDKKKSTRELLCVMELKYKKGFTPSNDIAKDYDKLQKYVQELDIGCRLYMATIWEYEDDETTWIRKNAAWAKGRLTELNASYERGTRKMRFYICPH